MKALVDAFSNLSPSDRRALGILAAFTSVMVLVFGGMSMRSMSRGAERAAKQAQGQYAEVLTLAQDFATAKSQKEALARRIRSSRVRSRAILRRCEQPRY